MQYRRYKPEDFAALYAIEEACFEPPLRFGRGLMRQLAASPRGAAWIAEENGRMVGFAAVEWSEEAGAAAAYIQTIEVVAEARGRGVGGELLRRVEDSARAAGAEWIWLHVDQENPAAIRLYENHGYTKQGREEHYYARNRAALVYARSLAASSA